MALRITISEIGEENLKDALGNPDDDLDWDDEAEENETGIVLTDHTVVNCKHIVEDMPGRNEFLSKYIQAIEISGRYNVADPTKERENVKVLFDWYKKTARDKEAYKKIEVSFRDVNNVEYKSVTFEKAFIVDGRRKGSNKEGIIEFFTLIRSFDEVEEAVRR